MGASRGGSCGHHDEPLIGVNGMNSIRSILAATDLSASARHAVARASQLAAERGAHLTILHVLDSRMMTNLPSRQRATGKAWPERLRNAAEQALFQLGQAMQQRYRLDPELQLATGPVLSEVLRVAESQDADLLVVGSHGEGYLRGLLLGSTTERLLRMASVPLLVVKQFPHASYGKVLVPVDCSDLSATALALVDSLAPQAARVLLNVYEMPFERKLYFAGLDDFELMEMRDFAQQEAAARLDAWIERHRLVVESPARVLLFGRPDVCILEQEQERDCDLIAIGKHGSGMIRDWLLGSVTKHVLALSSADVLVICASQRSDPQD